MAVDGDDDALGRKPQFASGALENALVGLVRHQPVDVADGQAVGFQGLEGDVGEIGDGMLENLASGHLNGADGLGRRRPAVNKKQFSLTSVGM